MALSLVAEQKSIKSLFLNDDRYIIPNYQRQYSWKYDQCKQLYDDITHAYDENDSYFIGNLILAVGENVDEYEVVDGQQRMITIWLFIKAISVLFPTMPKIRRLLELDSWDDESATKYESKITSNVFEANDDKQIERILELNREAYVDFLSEYQQYGETFFALHHGQMIANAVVIYQLLSEYFGRISEEDQKKFFDFLINKVYLLPIVLRENEIDAARNKALTVFETINNRGMDLQDADIFKARLYDMALRTQSKGDKFIEEWHEVSDKCQELSITIDDIFRYYYHIVRGQENIITSEIRLRDFFQKDSASPFKSGRYEAIMQSLNKIVDILFALQQKRRNGNDVSKWLQILDMYTNQYPQIALVTYLYYNQNCNEEELVNFIKSIIRYCFRRGSTTSVKFWIYGIISDIAHGKQIKEYVDVFDIEGALLYPGRLRNGWLLLIYYLSKEHTFSVNLSIDRIINNNEDIAMEENDYRYGRYISLIGSVANGIIVDGPKTKGRYVERISNYYMQNKIDDSALYLSLNSLHLYDILEDRLAHVMQLVNNFMYGEMKD